MPVYGAGSNASTRASNASNANSTNTATITQLQTFLSEFRVNEAFVYRDRLRANLLRKEYTLEVEMSHLIGWNEDLAARCRTEPSDLVPLVSGQITILTAALSDNRIVRRLVQFEVALRNLARAILYPNFGSLTQAERDVKTKELPAIQLQLRSGSRLMQFRELGVSTRLIIRMPLIRLIILL